MSKLVFEDSNTTPTKPSSGRPTMTALLVKYRITKNESQSKQLLIGVILLCLIITLLFSWPDQSRNQIDAKYYQDQILDE